MNKRKPLVLLYHRIAELERDPQRLAVTPAHFEEQMSVLQDRTQTVPLARLAADHVPRVAVTFDDGYEDNALAAVPVLAGAGVPATFFISSGFIGVDKEPWWDRLEAALLAGNTNAAHLDLNATLRLWADLRDEEGRRRAYWAMFWKLRPLPVDTIERVLKELWEALGTGPAPRVSHRMMDEPQLKSVAGAGFEIGGHTVSHPFLAAQTLEDQRHEINGCRADLQNITATPVESFSYPFGGPDAVGEATVRLVGDAGFDRACLVGRHSPAGLGRLEIPRVIVGDWTGERFERQLDTWLAE